MCRCRKESSSQKTGGGGICHIYFQHLCWLSTSIERHGSEEANPFWAIPTGTLVRIVLNVEIRWN